MYKHVMSYTSSSSYPFHMPGHKRNPDFLPKDLLALDITEVPGMDVLSRPDGIIARLQERIAGFYGAKHSFLITNGGTGGVVAAICAAHAAGCPIFAPRNAHTSLFHALALCGSRAVYYLPKILPDGLCGGVDVSCLQDMPHGAAVFVVSPTYEGFTSDIRALADLVHSRGGILIVDAAHGAHFAFHEAFPTCAIASADVVIHSLHKTLPALGQTALLHLCSRRIDRFLLQQHINFVQTTSPSYIMMTACDFMFDMLWKRQDLFDLLAKRLCELRDRMPPAALDTQIGLVGREVVGVGAVADLDISKLLFCINASPNEADIASRLLQHHIMPEMAQGRHVLALSTVADTAHGFNLLEHAISSINCGIIGEVSVCEYKLDEMRLPDVVMSPKEALTYPVEQIPWADAVGRVCAEIVAIYPPGIAVLAPGERILAYHGPIKPALWVLK